MQCSEKADCSAHSVGAWAAGNWSEQLLKSMYQVTWHHASAFPQETGQLWITVAANKRNVIPILDFVITQGLQEATELPEEVKGGTSHQ